MNRIYRRTGTLWEGRFKSALVEGERYLLAVSRYIEMNPVRAAMVPYPGDYQWSSYRVHAEGVTDGIVDFDPWYEGLGVDAEDRGRRYQRWIQESIPEGEWEAIREAISRGGFNGGDCFRDQVSQLIGRVLKVRPPGRPRKIEK
jgi:putative transposase